MLTFMPILSETDIYRAAQVMVRRYGDDATVQAAQRADELLDQGDIDGAATWRRIVKAIEVLQDKSRPAGAPVH